jgi:endonuclease YncB( thermonuclease family)
MRQALITLCLTLVPLSTWAETLQGKVLVDPPGEVFCMTLDCVKKIDAGLEQIRAGLAWHYKHYQMEQSEEDRMLYSEAELVANVRQIGLWKDEEPMAPWEWRRK